MRDEKRISLSTQVNLVFTLITLITSILFIIVFRQTINNYIKNQAKEHFISYNDSLLTTINQTSQNIETNNYRFIYVIVDNQYSLLETIKTNLPYQITMDDVNEIIGIYKKEETVRERNEIREYGNYEYILTERGNRIIIAFSDGSYALTIKNPISNIVTIGFISIIILGNAVILLWSSVTVERIKRLEESVATLSTNDYQAKIIVEGNDEISDLAEAIDMMREEIFNNEKVKQEMIQNISHDIKTPIAVIRSYAEAIKDGVTDDDDIDIIIKQSEVLNKKVEKLIEWNKLEYLNNKEPHKLISIKTIVLEIVNNYKYKSNITFNIELDESEYYGIRESFYSAISNIVENALRYAKNVINITLKEKKLTIYNDGEHIADEFINSTFKPYEKGHKGKFGLGMTIVQRTVNSFNLSLKVVNEEIGVSFIIEPRE